MVTSAHLFAGAAIGKLTGNFYLAIPIAFMSHYVLDAVPHYNPKAVKLYLKKGLQGVDKKDLLIKGIEPLLGVLITSFIAYTQKEFALIMIVSAFFAWVPDLLVFWEWKYNHNQGVITRIENIHHKHTTFFSGSIPQLIISILAFWIIF